MPTGAQGGAYLPKQPQSEPAYVVEVVPGDRLVQPGVSGNAVYWLTKATAAAIALAPATASQVQVGTTVIFIAGSAVAHVVTAQSGGIFDGTTGAKTKWTSAAFIGSSITLMAAPNGGWAVLAMNLGTVA